MGLLCRLFELWGQVGSGVLILTQWLLGEEDGGEDEAADEASNLDDEDFLFEKGDLNLWAEPLQWVKLLHQHLCSLILKLNPDQEAETVTSEKVHQIRTQAQAKALGSQQALDDLPALPQFCCPMEHARLTLRLRRATLALDVLDKLSATS